MMPSMRSDDFARAKALVEQALQMPPDQREAFLADACKDEDGIRREVESLLAHEADTPSLLATGGLGSAASSLLDTLAPPEDAAGDAIGNYEIGDLLGEGGMGAVYAARQVAPVQRDVAVKLIRRGLDTARVVARFDAERQTLARLDHPGIARILDAGADEQGRPFFVMERVDGVPITAYADAHRLPIRARLELFLEVCRAVAHAHQKGVLHRDLKPSNILVGEQDGRPAPKVIDFGVAKAIEPTTDAESLLTLDGQVIGTPEYMSPEQAGGTGGADTRSDVYSLGVVLYELLTGHRPHRLQGLPIADIQRVIATEQPALPSTAVTDGPAGGSADADAPDTAAIGASRSSTASRVRRELTGDLDNIVLMSLRKEPERRYPGVQQLADDVRRYLDGRPVLAQPDTWSYRTTKFVARHRVGVSMAAAASVALVIFTGVMTWQRNRALDAEARAASEATTSRQVSDFLVGLFREADPFVNQGEPLTARLLLDQGADRIASELRGQPEVQAALMGTMSQAYVGLRVPDRAVELAQGSLDLARRVYGEEHPEVATSMVALAAALASRSQQAEALPIYREALAMRERLLPPDHPGIIEATRLLAGNLHTLAELDEAEALHRRALAMTRRVVPEDHPDVTGALQRLGVILHGQGKVDEAVEVLEEALGRARNDGTSPVALGDILSELAVLFRNMERPDEAEPMYLEALEIREATFGAHPVAAQSYNNFGVFLRNQGRGEEALPHLERALAIHREAVGEDHLNVGIAWANLAAAQRALGRLGEAGRSYEAALSSIERSMGPDYWVYGQIEFNYGVFFRGQERYAEAEQHMVAGYEVVRDGLGAESRRTLLAIDGLVQLYEQWGRPDEAQAYRDLLPNPVDEQDKR